MNAQELTPDLVASLTLSTAGIFIGFIGLVFTINRKQVTSAVIIGGCMVFFLISLMIRYNHYFGWFA